MNKYLVIILVFIIAIPVGVINVLGHVLSTCEIDSGHCFFAKGSIAEADENGRFNPVYLIKAVSFYFLCVGGYFLVVHLRWIGTVKQKVSFLNQVSHELKTPLTNIRLYSDLLKDTLADDQAAMNKLSVIEQESKRLEGLVHNILSFSYGERFEMNMKCDDLDDVIEHVVDGFRPVFAQEGIEVRLDTQVGDAVFDRNILEQVLVNILSNVIKYASGGKFVSIKSSRHNGRVSIRVHDDGCGISQDLRERIFHPFERGDDNLTQNVSGLGIGLSLCVNLMEAHGGTLSLVDTDRGACFEVMF